MKVILVIWSFFLCLSVLGETSLYAIEETLINGKKISMKDYQGKTLVIVNIASHCGYTPQLEGLQGLYKKYQKSGLVVLGVPSNEFMGQSPEDNQAFKEFCRKNYEVSFPLLSKGKVNGKERRSLYRYLVNSKIGQKKDISWNFNKFVVSKKGEVLKRFSSSDKPKEIEKYLLDEVL